MKNEHGYTGELPAEVRHDPGLKPAAKVLFAEITANRTGSGTCTATNEFLADLLNNKHKARGRFAPKGEGNTSPATVSKWVKALRDKGYVRAIYICHPEGKQTRILFPHTSMGYHKIEDGQKINYKDLIIADDYFNIRAGKSLLTILTLAEGRRCLNEQQRNGADDHFNISPPPPMTILTPATPADDHFNKQCININNIPKNINIYNQPNSENESEQQENSEAIPGPHGCKQDAPGEHQGPRPPTPEVDQLPVQPQGKPDTDQIPLRELLDYFNEVTGKFFLTINPISITYLRDWWAKGYRMTDFRYVIEVMSAHWKGTKYGNALTFKKLFGPEFETWRNWKPPEKNETPGTDPGLTPERLAMIEKMNRNGERFLQGDKGGANV